MTSKGISSIDKGINMIAVIAIIAVVVIVLLGFIRLALDHWGNIVLVALGAWAAYYLYSKVRNA
jgi:hypothetical protein